MAKDARVPVRLPSALKDEFEWAAEQDGTRGVSTWLRQLGEQRAEELRAQQNGSFEHAEHGPALVFVPGLGLDEKGDE